MRESWEVECIHAHDCFADNNRRWPAKGWYESDAFSCGCGPCHCMTDAERLELAIERQAKKARAQEVMPPCGGDGPT
jgi:hypothetical protein